MPISNAEDPLWYKDAVFYQLHVKSFADGNGDGIGDFVGLTSKLDYLESLGVNCLWIQPMYPSPFRDDGYDISDYTNIHPSYGTLRGVPHVPQRGASARSASGRRARPEPHVGSAPVVSSKRAARATIPAAIGTSGATPTSGIAGFASSFSIRSIRTGPGIPSRRPITGTASSAISRI